MTKASLGSRDVHVWRIDLDRPFADEATLSAWLSGTELERAQRFRRDRDRRRYIAGRGTLRRVLADYLDTAPGRVRLVTGEHGKPALAGGELEFNLTHAGGLALLAVTRVAPIGVDVEQLHAVPELEPIARRFFTAAESRRISSAPEGAREQLFFRCWTRKEAYLKAVGGGLSIPLRSVDVSLDGRPRLNSIEGDDLAATQWTLRHLMPAEGYIGAVALRARGVLLRCMTWGFARGNATRGNSAA